MIIIDHLSDWLYSTDCYGNRMVQDWEIDFIFNHLNELTEDDLVIVEGDLKKDEPNDILIDITHLAPDDFQPGKSVIISLAHFIRPCPCKSKCHNWQYECYLNDCDCCSGECT